MKSNFPLTSCTRLYNIKNIAVTNNGAMNDKVDLITWISDGLATKY
jgi:hypothetical protein